MASTLLDMETEADRLKQASVVMKPQLERTERSRLRRHPERGLHDRAAAEAILDEALFCHVAGSIDGAAHVLPTAHARVGDVLYFHGARKNHLLSALVRGAQACVSVTLLDGLVFARSAFSHSVNFRSVVLYGVASEVEDIQEKRRALDALIEHMAKGRAAESRPPNDDELRQTLVVRFPIGEGAVKVRQGPPLDAEREPDSPHWAGVVPVRLIADIPVPDPLLHPQIATSSSVAARAQTMTLGSPYEVRRDALCISTDYTKLDVDLVHSFLARESYWARGVDRLLQERSMQRSLCFGLYEQERQLGFARVVSDHGRFAYLGDVFVVREARGRGLGKWLVESVLAHPALRGVERWLLGTADAHSLYARFGFVQAPEGRYMVRRTQP